MQKSAAIAEKQAAQSDAARKEAQEAAEQAQSQAAQQSAATAKEQAAQSDAARKEAQEAAEQAQSQAAQQSAATAKEQAAQSDAARKEAQEAAEQAQSQAAQQSAAAAKEQAVQSAQSVTESAASDEAVASKQAQSAVAEKVQAVESEANDENKSTVETNEVASVTDTVASETADVTEKASTQSEASEAAEQSADVTKDKATEVDDDKNTESDSQAVAAENETESQTEESTTEKYDRGLKKSRTGFGAKLNHFLANFRHVDEDFFEDLEDLLIESDVGYDMAMKISDELREEVKLQNAKSKQDVSNVIIEKMVDLYEDAGRDENPDLNFAKEGPTVIMFVGVNGAGKTTTIGKMAKRFKDEGKRVLLAAGDTFRAGAVEQLDVWAKRDGVDIVMGPANGDPAAVVFDGVKKAKEENYDILLVDTAGRLQNKVNLMNELAKMKRIMAREIPDAPHEVLLVLDATTGQNALNQAKLFKESTDVSGIVLTKLDGTARGGIVLAIRNELHLPVKYVGLGEKVTDLQKFDASDFVYGLFKGLVVEK
ncbi:signal recognition particle-docking protein FtsY [Limosilactobacillus mucosae]|uniref:Signal recognition particle receptor FtsY n=2 Tax=Limosilactobacillus mucosae TaxID=97478 RepID=A0AAJ1HT06_LIMMU|nr:signal recognition particle-docking protein FtsY [Limosilactobacillus mucosae]MDC2830194.1 signal recognition particle-docking protein FtsY [Limosilactobacillus mucosae]MDC2837765.1 signal recognition particle-docking protein FtsY [Limosilactobacillus mucosae]MDC2853918.1 signal recognition particle-docking protein FtsY [Limosilactobacillus mucosae]